MTMLYRCEINFVGNIRKRHSIASNLGLFAISPPILLFNHSKVYLMDRYQKKSLKMITEVMQYCLPLVSLREPLSV